MWGGRFSGGTHKKVEDYTDSLKVDRNLWKYEVRASISYAKALKRAGVLSASEEKKIVSALLKIKREFEEGQFVFKETDEDIHTAIERRLVEIAGETGKKLHAGRSRNEQVATDIRLYLKDAGKAIEKNLAQVIWRLTEMALNEANTPMPGYTHLQRAQVVTLGHHLNAYAAAFYRHLTRTQDFLKRADELPLGSGALAGNTLNIDRYFLMRDLGFSRISLNSMDAVATRDLLQEALFICSGIMVTCSRLGEELVVWSTDEFGFVSLPDEVCTGSSLMPQKKNPDVPELIRGKTSSVISALMGILTLEKNLPLTYNRDLQEDKSFLFNGVEITVNTLELIDLTLSKCTFNRERMKSAASDWKLFMTDLAEKLVRKGVPFRDAHEAVGKLTSFCLKNNLEPSEVDEAKLKNIHPDLSREDVRTLGISESLKWRKVPGGPAPSEVRKTARYLRRKVQRFLEV